tara:strand:- start:1082 stop:1837 length:756 start_codon:yes stop_codon:yes gene_type:complete
LSNKHNIDILIISCDAYSDVWDIFFKSFHKQWINCPLKLTLLTNNKSYDSNLVNTIKVGDDVSWSDNLLKGIEELQNDYILILLDDLFLTKKISDNYFNKISNWINQNNPNYLRLCNSSKPNYFDDLVGRLPKITPYKTSTMPCIWKKFVLQELLKEGESAWDFEIKGSKRAYKYDRFYAVYNDFITYKNGIIKGKWRRSIVKKNYNYDLNKKDLSRPIMTLIEEYKYSFRKLRSALFNKFPNQLRVFLKG